MGLAGLSGLLYALVSNGIKWDTGLQILLLLFAAVTLGGLGTAFGALIGALIIGLVVELRRSAGHARRLQVRDRAGASIILSCCADRRACSAGRSGSGERGTDDMDNIQSILNACCARRSRRRPPRSRSP